MILKLRLPPTPSGELFRIDLTKIPSPMEERAALKPGGGRDDGTLRYILRKWQMSIVLLQGSQQLAIQEETDLMHFAIIAPRDIADPEVYPVISKLKHRHRRHF